MSDRIIRSRLLVDSFTMGFQRMGLPQQITVYNQTLHEWNLMGALLSFLFFVPSKKKRTAGELVSLTDKGKRNITQSKGTGSSSTLAFYFNAFFYSYPRLEQIVIAAG